MSRVAMGSSVGANAGWPFGPRVTARYEPVGGLVNQGIGAEMIADQWGISREELDEFSLESHRRAARATAEGRFEREIIPVAVRDDEGQRHRRGGDERRGHSPGLQLETLAKLKPAFKEGGKVTAGNSSQITDGASAVLIMSEERAASSWATGPALGSTPSPSPASIRSRCSPGPIPATPKILERAGLTLDDIDLVEINEAFASVVLAWQRELKADLEKVNVNGGAIALGHPSALRARNCARRCSTNSSGRNGRYGLLTMCEGGGLANATIIERLGVATICSRSRGRTRRRSPPALRPGTRPTSRPVARRGSSR